MGPTISRKVSRMPRKGSPSTPWKCKSHLQLGGTEFEGSLRPTEILCERIDPRTLLENTPALHKNKCTKIRNVGKTNVTIKCIRFMSIKYYFQLVSCFGLLRC